MGKKPLLQADLDFIAQQLAKKEAEYVRKKFGLILVKEDECAYRLSDKRETVSLLFRDGRPHTPLGALHAFVDAYGHVLSGRASQALITKVDIMRRKFFPNNDRLDAVLLDTSVREGKLVIESSENTSDTDNEGLA